MSSDAAEHEREALRSAVEAVRSRTAAEPRVAVALGRGVGAVAGEVEVEASVPLDEARLLFGRLGGTAVVVLDRRRYAYEGYGLREAAFPVRLLHALGARTLVLPGLCRGVGPFLRVGELVAVHDHLNLLGDNPLIGPNLDELGPRFPDMSEPYDAGLRAAAQEAALELGVPLHEGVYAALAGPSLESRAEYRMVRELGADVVGRGTVPETIVARHMGMKVVALKIVALADLAGAGAGSPDEAERVAEAQAPVLAELLGRMLQGGAGA